ncbi:CD209 antigen-like protein B [Pseudorasbora parva]|uniref:CD209 antigen-like protein B n=1 Tax=Pseudorasbora parva TaxID=51549 RepID=UPI00351F4CC4
MKSGRYIVNKVTEGATGPQTQSHFQDEGKAQMCRGRRCLVLTVCLGLICVVLLIFIIIITAERDLFKSYKNTAEELNQTINSLQDNYTDLMTEKDQLKNSNSLNGTRVKDRPDEKSQLQRNLSYLNENKLELVTRVNDLTAEKGQLQRRVDTLSQEKLELETRVNDLTAEKGQLQGRVDTLSQEKLELETRVNDHTAEKGQLEGRVDSLSQEKLELERNLTSLGEELKNKSKQGYLWGPDGLFMSSEEKSWSDSRQYCRDRGADLVIINTEVKQRHITSFIKESVWIGLSENKKDGNMTWVDNSPLKQEFWYEKPNNANGDEDCVELMPSAHILNNWNDLQCSMKRKGICEKKGACF